MHLISFSNVKYLHQIVQEVCQLFILIYSSFLLYRNRTTKNFQLLAGLGGL